MRDVINGTDADGKVQPVLVNSDGSLVIGGVTSLTVNGSATDTELRASPLPVTLVATHSTGGQGSKNIAVAGTPAALAASTACTSVIITARKGNTKEIAYGFSNAVRATAGSEIGAQLQPGESVTLYVTNLSLIWIDAQVNGEGVSFTYTTN